MTGIPADELEQIKSAIAYDGGDAGLHTRNGAFFDENSDPEARAEYLRQTYGHSSVSWDISEDAMSYASLQRMAGNGDLAARYYVASCGAGDANILAFLQGHPGVRSVMLCQDNDEAGHKMAGGLAEKLRDMGYNVSRSVPKGKDFNDDLLEARNWDADRAPLPEAPPPEPEYLSDEMEAGI